MLLIILVPCSRLQELRFTSFPQPLRALSTSLLSKQRKMLHLSGSLVLQQQRRQQTECCIRLSFRFLHCLVREPITPENTLARDLRCRGIRWPIRGVSLTSGMAIGGGMLLAEGPSLAYELLQYMIGVMSAITLTDRFLARLPRFEYTSHPCPGRLWTWCRWTDCPVCELEGSRTRFLLPPPPYPSKNTTGSMEVKIFTKEPIDASQSATESYKSTALNCDKIQIALVFFSHVLRQHPELHC
ncbi:hypothetical protein K491DRAFT_398515 [Lophiostoma macrostomum CBS 122681]|uniref:Uncharacterized protein n=1 Tax=Lophiostoma macrostomum CBS 122681 TaxID=1314788 RepID=A0A6A6TBG8_9PLEO|nr:hypothetical protein K491DRAFT_398515 [Lophiostoma macrostomum CBS 122681]